MINTDIVSHYSIDGEKKTNGSTPSNELTHKYKRSKQPSLSSFSSVNESIITFTGKNSNVKTKTEIGIDVSSGEYFEKIKETRFKNLVTRQSLNKKEKNQRRQVVDWMIELGESLNLMRVTVHKAIMLIDRIMEYNFLKENELKNIGLVCLILSVKYMETQEEIKNLVRILKQSLYNGRDISRCEMQIMYYLNWDLHCVTPVEFIHVFKSGGALFYSNNISSLKASSFSLNSIIETEDLGDQLNNVLEYICNKCIKEYDLIKQDPLLLAAGILLITIRSLGLKITWNTQLEQLTTIPSHIAENYASIILTHIRYISQDEFDEGIRMITLPKISKICTMSCVNAKYENRVKKCRIALYK